VLLVVAALAALVTGDVGLWLSWLAFLSWLACAGVTVAKGKWRLAVIDAFVWLFSYVAAFRLAKPRSLWARRIYDQQKMHRARVRYGVTPAEYELDEMTA
jgi:hypothetical protein